MKTSHLYRGLSALALCLTMTAQSVYAADYYAIDNNKAQKIDEHRICNVVTNKAGGIVNIPTNFSNEWSNGGDSFLADERDGMIVTPCSKPDVFASCPTSTQSTPYGRRNTSVIVLQTLNDSNSSVSLAAAARGGVNAMVNEIKKCGGNVTVTFLEGWGQRPSQGSGSSNNSAGDGNQDSLSREDKFYYRNVPVATAPALTTGNVSPYRASFWLGNAVGEGSSYMRSLIRATPTNNRYVFVVTGVGSMSTGDTLHSRNKGLFDAMINEAKTQQNDVEVIFAGAAGAGVSNVLGIGAARSTSVATSDFDDLLWSVGRNISMYAQGMAQNAAFNVAQKAVFP